MVSQIGKLLKSAGKIAKQIRSCSPIVAKNGQKLTKGQKLVNTVFNAADKAEIPTLLGTWGIAGVSGIPLVYGVVTDNKNLGEKGFFGFSKGIDACLGGMLGGLVGGPIGCLLGACLAYSTDYSIFGSLPAISEDFTIEDCHTKMAETRQETYDSVKELFGFNKSEEVTTTEDKARQPETAPQKTDNKIKFTNKDTNEEIKYEYGWIHPNKNMTLTNSKGETFTLEKDITYFVERDGTIKECISSCYLTPDGNWFGGSIPINDPYTLDYDGTYKTANGGIYETKKGDIVTYLKDGSLKVEKPFIINEQTSYLEVGKTYTADKDFKLLGTDIHKGDKYFVRMDGGIVIMNSETEPNNQLAEFTVSGSDNQFIQKTGQYFCADKDMDLTDKYGIKYSIEEGDTYICDESGKIIIKYTAGRAHNIKEDIVLNGSFGQVTVKAGKSFYLTSEGLYVTLEKDETVTDKNGKEYNAQADDHVIYNNDGTISIEKVMGTSNDGAYPLIVGKEYIADIATTMTDHNGIEHTINVGDKYFCDENGAVTVIPQNKTNTEKEITIQKPKNGKYIFKLKNTQKEEQQNTKTEENQEITIQKPKNGKYQFKLKK